MAGLQKTTIGGLQLGLNLGPTFGVQAIDRASTQNRDTNLNPPMTPVPRQSVVPQAQAQQNVLNQSVLPNNTITRDYKSSNIDYGIQDLDNNISALKNSMFAINPLKQNIGATPVTSGVQGTSYEKTVNNPQFQKAYTQEQANIVNQRSMYQNADKNFADQNYRQLMEEPKKEKLSDYTQEEFNQLPQYKQQEMLINDKKDYLANQIRQQFGDQIPATATTNDIVNDFASQQPDKVKELLKPELDKVGAFAEIVNGRLVINTKPYKDLTYEQKAMKDEKDNEDISNFWDKLKLDTKGLNYNMNEAINKQMANPAAHNWDTSSKEDKINYIKDMWNTATGVAGKGVADLYNMLIPEMGELVGKAGTAIKKGYDKGGLLGAGETTLKGGKDLATGLAGMAVGLADKLITNPDQFMYDALTNPAETTLAIEGIMSIPKVVESVANAPKNVQAFVAKTHDMAQDLKTGTKEAMENFKLKYQEATELAQRQRQQLEYSRPVTPSTQMTPKIENYINKSIGQSIVGKKTANSVSDFNNSALEANKSIIQNKNNLELTDVNGETVVGKAPETLSQWSEAIEQTKENLFKQRQKIAQEAGINVEVDTQPIINRLNEYKSKLPVIGSRSAHTYIDNLIRELQDNPVLSVEQTQTQLKNLNENLANFFKNMNKTKDTTDVATIDNEFRSALKNELDSRLEQATGGPEYEQLNKQYSNLLKIEKQVNQKMIVEMRKNTKGLTDLPSIFANGDIGMGIVKIAMGDVSGTMNIAKGAIEKAMIKWFQNVNSRDANVGRLFKEIEKQGAGMGIDVENAVNNAKMRIPALPEPTQSPTLEAGKTNIVSGKPITVTPEGQAIREGQIGEINPLQSKVKENGGANLTNSVRSNSDLSSKKTLNPLAPSKGLEKPSTTKGLKKPSDINPNIDASNSVLQIFDSNGKSIGYKTIPSSLRDKTLSFDTNSKMRSIGDNKYHLTAGDVIKKTQKNLGELSVDEFNSLSKQSKSNPLLAKSDNQVIRMNGDIDKNKLNELVAIHNLNKDKLQKIVELGGMPAPSIAITKKGIPFEDFGDITLIGNKDLVSSKGSNIYTTDVYSPRVTQPTLVPRKGKEMNDLISKIAKETGQPEWRISNKIDNWSDKQYFLDDMPELKKYESQIDGMFDKKIFKGFTYSGKRQYKDYTLDNVLKDMMSRGKQGSESSIFEGSLNQMTAKEANKTTVSGLKKFNFSEKGKLDDIYKKADDKWSNAIEKIADKSDKGHFDVVRNIAYEVSNKRSTESIVKSLNEYGIKVNANDVDNLKLIIKEALSLPKSYVEAKVWRGVGLDEFTSVLVPESQVSEVKNMLKGTKLEDKIVSYAKGESRVSKLNDINKKYGNIFFGIGATMIPAGYMLNNLLSSNK